MDIEAMVKAAESVDGGPGAWSVTCEDEEICLSWVAQADDPRVESMCGNEVWTEYGGDEILAAGGVDVTSIFFRSGGLAFLDCYGRDMYEEWMSIPVDQHDDA